MSGPSSTRSRIEWKAMTEPELAVGGWMVKVITPAPGRAEPIEDWYVVGRTAKMDAELTTQQHSGLEAATIDARRPLTALEIEWLELKPDEVRRHS
jgi:hypothetical protein